jgi:hypothetical protein
MVEYLLTDLGEWSAAYTFTYEVDHLLVGHAIPHAVACKYHEFVSLLYRVRGHIGMRRDDLLVATPRLVDLVFEVAESAREI